MIPGMLDRLPALVNDDPQLVARGRWLSTRFLVGVGPADWLVHVHEGRVTRVERGPFLLREWAFSIRAPEAAWRQHWEAVPAPGYHDLFAMARLGHLRLEGDLATLMRHLRYVKDVLAAPRPRAARPPAPPAAAEAPGTIEPIVGATCASPSPAARTASTSRRRGRASPSCACTPPAPTAASGAT
jgi:hypothetical protein